jgi:hypothetical protein
VVRSSPRKHSWVLSGQRTPSGAESFLASSGHLRGDEAIRNVRNVFLCEENARKGRYRLLAMDQSAILRFE